MENDLLVVGLLSLTRRCPSWWLVTVGSMSVKLKQQQYTKEMVHFKNDILSYGYT